MFSVASNYYIYSTQQLNQSVNRMLVQVYLRNIFAWYVTSDVLKQINRDDSVYNCSVSDQIKTFEQSKQKILQHNKHKCGAFFLHYSLFWRMLFADLFLPAISIMCCKS